jgi:hypothetical protein
VAITDGKASAWWPVLAFVLVATFFSGVAFANAAKAYTMAEEALMRANGIDVRLERIQTVLERIERSQK